MQRLPFSCTSTSVFGLGSWHDARQSLRAPSGTHQLLGLLPRRDLVVLLAGPLSTESEDTLINEGWNVRHVDAIRNPGMWHGSGGAAFPPRFWAVYTKLAIFNMTEYSQGRPGRSFVNWTTMCGGTAVSCKLTPGDAGL